MSDQTTRRSLNLTVERDRDAVTLTIKCADEYAEMQLYDEVCEGGRAGRIELKVETREGSAHV